MQNFNLRHPPRKGISVEHGFSVGYLTLAQTSRLDDIHTLVYTDSMNRHNFYVDEERMAMLRKLAFAQDASVSELLREAIDILIAERMNNPRPSVEERRAAFDAFIKRYAGTQKRERISDEALLDAVSADRRSKRKRKAAAR